MLTLIAVATLICVKTMANEVCVTPGGAGGTFFLSVTSRRNSTGHRRVTAEVNIPVATQTFRNIPGDVHLEVAQRASVVGIEKNLQLVAAFEVPETSVPPQGYELAPGLGWYRLHLQPLTWEKARLACEAEGTHLAVLNSPEEATALKAIFAKAPKSIANASYSDKAFVGFSDILVEGSYVTLFGRTLSQEGYDSWEQGQPNNMRSDIDPDQDCGAIERSTGKLNDIQCRARLPYFCEYTQ